MMLGPLWHFYKVCGWVVTSGFGMPGKVVSGSGHNGKSGDSVVALTASVACVHHHCEYQYRHCTHRDVYKYAWTQSTVHADEV